LKVFITTIFLFFSIISDAQVFDNKEIQKVIKKGVDFIYNASYDSALHYIDSVDKEIPNHPVVPLMKAMNILWSNIPLINDSVFYHMKKNLEECISFSEILDPELESAEYIYFTMAARGLLAENYAEQDQYVKAVGEASKAYLLLKKGFDLIDENNEFLLTTGLYNYFREKYPEKHPVYKPLLWFFRPGDINQGLKQLRQASEITLFSKVEAQIYLSYIYLRYEYNPELAQGYLSNLCSIYPQNFYAKAKFLESIANPIDFINAPLEQIYYLIKHESPYYRLAGNAFLGYYLEVVRDDELKALKFYKKGVENGDQIPDHGEFFKSFAYLGMGRIYFKNGDSISAKKYLNLSIEYAETKQVKEEAKKLLATI